MNTNTILSHRHWVFDLDGTLTLPVHDFAAIRHALGVPRVTDILGYLASLPEDEARSTHDRLVEIETGLLDRIEPAPGLLQLITLLHLRGCRLGILTRNTREVAIRTLDRLGIMAYFSEECILGRCCVLPKPDPEGLFRLSEQWGTVTREMVMVGDYLFDLQTGRNAGAATVHVDRTRGFPWPELTDVGVATLAELLEFLPD